MNGLALYIHFPFCAALCPYCDFNVHIKRDISERDFIAAIESELDLLAAEILPSQITSIFFGGGTPSLMTPATIAAILAKVAKVFEIAPKIEITLEANPEHATEKLFEAFHHVGINRLSLGVQSLDDDALQFLGRRHNAAEAAHAIECARKIFPLMSFDLIYARPEQTPKHWEAELTEALRFCPDHLSLYQLTAPTGTKLAQQIARGIVRLPDDDVAATLYEQSETLCAAADLKRYEISNHARVGFEAKHNLSYWRYQNYAGLGAGAHGRLRLKNENVVATLTPRQPKIWAASAQNNFFKKHFEATALSAKTQKKEQIIMGLRLTQGIAYEKNMFDENKIKSLTELGLIATSTTHLRATKNGALLLDKIIAALIN